MRLRKEFEYASGISLDLCSEGNSVAKWFDDWAKVDCLVEVGIPIRIIHRISVRSRNLISSYHCVIQYQRLLKTERYDEVRVVSLSSLPTSHQRVGSEVILKYDVRDNVSSSIVFRSSKWNEASGNPLLEFIYKPKLNLLLVQTINK